MTLALAPLAGFTDGPFRRLCGEGGADLAYTEMVSAAALAHGNVPTRLLMERMPGEGPLACQIFGADERELSVAVREVEKFDPRFAAIDLNAGCPVPKVLKCGAGAKLVPDPAKVHRLLKAMRENTSLPVTLKTRLGPRPGDIRIFELVDAAASAGAASVTVHARFTSQMHGGPVHLDLLADAVARAPIPVIGNGSVTDRATAKAMAETGVAGIMIGRAALARPDIFRELKGETVEPPDALALARRHLNYLLEFRRLLEERHPDAHVPSEDGFASVKMHVHLFRYFNGRPGAAALRARLNTVRTLAEVRAILAER